MLNCRGIELAGGGGVVIKWRGCNNMAYREIATTLKEVEILMILPDCVKRKLDGVVDSIPLDKGCEVLDGKLTHE